MILPAGAQTTSSNVEYMDYELVLCDTDVDGDIEKIQLMNWIALNGDGTTDVEMDKAFEETTSWQGIHGWTTPTDEGDLLLWEGLSTSDFANFPAMTTFSESMVEDSAMRIPLDVRYQYWLDGKPVDPNDITGESGHFRMELTLTNTSEEMTVVEYEDPETGEMMETEIETYLPMVIIPYDWYFDNTTFFNMECDPTGLVFWMPDFYQVGWSIPLFPPATEDSHTIWVEADVKNFHLPTFTLPVAFVFPETNQIDTTAIFKNGLEQLFDGVKQLDEGLVMAEEGIGDPGTADTLLYGISAVNEGMAQLAGSLPTAKAGVDNDMIPGVQQAVAGIGSEATSDTLLYAVYQTTLGLQGLVAGIGGPTTPDTLLYGTALMAAGLNEAAAAIGSSTTDETLLYAANQIILGLSNTDPLNPGLLQAAQGIQAGSVTGGAIDTNLANIRGLCALLIATYPQFAGSPPADPSVQNIDAIAQGLQAAISQAGATPPSIYDAATGMVAGIGSASTPGTMLYGASAIYGGLDFIKQGIGSATTPDTLLYAVAQLDYGLNLIVDQVGSSTTPDTALYAMAQMQYGLTEMKAGLSTGDPNNPGLLEGLVLLSGGLGQAIQGLGSPGTPDTLLYGGAMEEAGLVELGAGLSEGTGGTALMLESLMDTLVMLNVTEAELEAIAMRGEEFDHFLGRAEGAEENQVRFVYQTKPAYNYVEGNSWLTALILSIVIGLLLLIGGILLIRAFA